MILHLLSIELVFKKMYLEFKNQSNIFSFLHFTTSKMWEILKVSVILQLGSEKYSLAFKKLQLRTIYRCI